MNHIAQQLNYQAYQQCIINGLAVHQYAIFVLIVLYNFIQQMKAKALAQRHSLIHSLKSISMDCEELFFGGTPRTHPSIPSDYTPSTPNPLQPSFSSFPTQIRCHSAQGNFQTPKKMSQVRAASVINRRGSSILSQDPDTAICRKVYRKKIEQTKLKENVKQETLFVHKLAHSIQRNTANLINYQITPTSLKELNQFLLLHNIQELLLDKNPIGDDGLAQLLLLLPKIQLKKLSLGSIGMHEKGCDALLLTLANSKHLQCLKLCSYEGSYRNRLHHDSIKNIEKLLKVGLKKLNLSNTSIDDHSFVYLCDAIKKGCTLQLLNISQNDITEVGMELFKQSAVRVQLQELDISKNKILGSGFVEMASLIGTDYNLTKISKSLKVLKVCYAKNKKNAFHHFCKELDRNLILQQLYIDYLQSQKHNFVWYLSVFLRRNWSLKKLSLKKCIQMGTDCKDLWSALLENRGIQTLILAENHFESASYKYMFHCLAQSKMLNVLDLRACKISDSDLIKASDSFSKLKLKKLFLDYNLINNLGADIIEKMIYKNKKVEELTLKGNSLTEKKLQELRKALKYNIDANTNVEFELNHYQYVEESNLSQKEMLLKAVSELKEKEKSLRYRHLLHYIAKRQVQNGLKQKEMKKQSEEVGKLSDLNEHFQKVLQLGQQITNEKKENEELSKMGNLKLREKSSYLGMSQVSEITSSVELVQKQSISQ